MNLFRKFRALFRKEKLDRDMAEEMRFHLAQRAADHVDDGMSADEARYAAQRKFGGVEQIKERCRDERARGFIWLEHVQKDVRHTARSLLRTPGFTAVAVLTLAFGIGVNTAAFSVLNALLLHVPPYPEPDTLLRLYRTTPRGDSGATSPANFLDYRAQNTVFTDVAAVRFTDFNLGEPGQPTDRIRGMIVTADFFPLLGISPQLGRAFTAEEDRPGGDEVVVISHDTWQQRFAGDPTIVGRPIRIDGEPVTIIGVMPARFDDWHLWGNVAAWRPMRLPEIANADRENTYLRVIARLQPGVTRAQAQAEMNVLSAQLALAYPATNTELGVRLESLVRSAQNADQRRVTWLVTGLAGFVLLIACANLANLQFTRNAARAREYAVRAALGASRAHLVRIVLSESILLALAGGAAGLVLATWTSEFAGRAFSFGEQTGLDLSLDRRVLVFTFVVSLLTGGGFGLLPAWLASRDNVGDALKQGGRGFTAGRTQHRVRHALIVTEVALALVLLAGAGFFVHGLQRVVQRDAGWDTDNVLTASLSLRGPNYATTAARSGFYDRLHARLKTLPGVEQVAITTSPPTAGYDTGNSFVVEGLPPPPRGRQPVADVAAVTPGYFEALGMRLLQGRDFTEHDRTDNPAVVVINETMARQFWPGENPVGKRIGGATPFMENPREIIGVVSDARSAATLDDRGERFQFYRSLYQWSFNSAAIVLRSRQAPETVAHDLRRALAELDPDQAVYRVTTVRHEIDRRFEPIDVAARALTGFAFLGLLLAAVGIYGVIANSVVLRTNEIGIRMALGAQMRDIRALVLGGGVRLTLMGVALGVAGSFGMSRLLASIAPEFGASGIGLIAGVTLLLIAVALFACWLPARRAAKIEPTVALRAE
jgi:putative ABC transport system permease protein